MNNLSQLNAKRLALFIIVLAAVLRLLGIWHGYPYSYYPDEAHFVKRALSFGSGDLNPHWFHKPAFYMYVLFFEYGLYFLCGKAAGYWNYISEFAVSYIKNPGPFYLLGRLTTVLFSVGSIWIVYLLGERHFRKGTGILAALFLSLSLGHLAASQVVKADVPATFFVVLSALLLLDYSEHKRHRDLLAAAAVAGIGTATKAYPILMLMPILAGIVLVRANAAGRGISRQMGKYIFLAGTVLFAFYLLYFICSPYNFIDPLGRKAVFSPYLTLFEKISPVFGGGKIPSPGDFIGERMGRIDGAIDYFRALVAPSGMGLTLAGIGIAGLGCLLLRLTRQSFLFLLYPILFVAASVFIHPGYAEARHQLPIYPFLSIAGGALIVDLVAKKYVPTALICVGLVLLLAFPLHNVLKRAIYLSRQDTRNVAKSWIENNIPPYTRILADENGPQLLMTQLQIQELHNRAKQMDLRGQFTSHYDKYLGFQQLAAKSSITYTLQEIRFPWWRESEIREGIHVLTTEYDKDMANPLKPVGVNRYAYYVQNGFEYAIVHSYKYGRFLKDTGVANNFPSFAGFYRDLFANGKLIKEFSPHKDHMSGPTVKVFKFVPRDSGDAQPSKPKVLAAD